MSTEASPLLPRPSSPLASGGPSAPSDALSRHELAAWIIDGTMHGMCITSADGLPRSRRARSAYLLSHNFAFIRQAAAFILVMLSFFELPSWCSRQLGCVAVDPTADVFLSGVPYLDASRQMLVNFLCLLVLVFFAIFDHFALPKASSQLKPRMMHIVLAGLLVDFVWVLFWDGYPPFRPAPYLRAFLPLLYWDSVRECTVSILAVIPPFLNVFAIVAIFVLVFGWVVTLVFHDVPSVDRYFGNLTIGLYSAFTAITTADWPMQIMGILDISRASALLFLVFIVLGVFLLFNVMLAVVYNAYTGHIEELVIDKLQARRQSIAIAYDILVAATGACTLPDVKLLFDELRKNKTHSHVDEERVDLVFTALDDDADQLLSRDEFLDIVEVLQLKFVFELESISPIEKYFPNFYVTPFWRSVSSYVRSSTFVYHIDAIMFLNVAVVLLESTMDLRKKDTPASIMFFAMLEAAFSVVYIIEMLLKVASQGFDRYWQDRGNRFDFAVTWLLLLGAAYVLNPFSEANPEVVRYLVLLRCLRLFAILADIPRFRRIVQVFSVLIPASVPLFSFFFISLYVFAAAGVELFGGLIYSTNPALDPNLHPLVDAYVSNDYWSLNFNDMASGWYTLFSSVIVAYLTEIAEVIASASPYGDWTKWFFMFSFVVNSLLVSNCVLAFVVDLFVMEDEDQEEQTAEMASLQSRYGTKRVKVHQAKSTADQVYLSMFKNRVQELFADSELSGSP